MKFTVDLHGTLEADDVEDALARIGRHFTSQASDEDYVDSPFQAPTKILISPWPQGGGL